MLLFNKILNFFSKDIEKHYEVDIIYKVLIVNLYSLMTFVLTFIFSIFNFIDNDIITGLFFLFVSILLGINFMLFKKNVKYETQRNFFTVIYIVSALLLVIFGDSNHSGLFWAFLFPSISLYLYNYKKGILFAFLFLTLICFANFIYIYENTDFSNPNFLVEFWFVLPYIVLSFVVYIFEYIYEIKQELIEKDIIKNQKNSVVKDEVLTKISYLIRSPLNNILGLKSILEQTQLDEYQKDLLSSIEASIGNLNNVIEQVDSVSGYKSEAEKNNLIALNLRNTIKRTIDFYQSANKNLKIDFVFSDEIPDKLTGNPVAIKQIFINLIELVLKYLPGNLKINLNAVKRCEVNDLFTCAFVFKVLDNIEIQRSINIDKILEFSILKASIEKLFGKIKVYAEKDSTVFEFFIEFENTSENGFLQADNKLQEQNLISNQKISMKDANILVVEDNEINQKVIELSLNKYVRNIDFAGNGKEALDLYGKNKYNLIIMDIQMPIMDGIKTTQKIREAEIATKTHTPIIAITANALIHDKHTCINAGMDDYIAKPYKIQDVIEKIEKLLLKFN